MRAHCTPFERQVVVIQLLIRMKVFDVGLLCLLFASTSQVNAVGWAEMTRFCVWQRFEFYIPSGFCIMHCKIQREIAACAARFCYCKSMPDMGRRRSSLGNHYPFEASMPAPLLELADGTQK